jgi:hypothetical protein
MLHVLRCALHVRILHTCTVHAHGRPPSTLTRCCRRISRLHATEHLLKREIQACASPPLFLLAFAWLHTCALLSAHTAETTSAPGLQSPLPTSATGPGSSHPRPQRHCADPLLATPAPGLGALLPHLHRDLAGRCHIRVCTRTGALQMTGDSGPRRRGGAG